MRAHAASLLAPLFLLPAASCSISTQVQYQDVHVGSRPYARTLQSGQYAAAARIDGVSLDISLAEQASCERGQIRSIHRTEHSLRTAHPSPWALVVPGVALAGLGVGVVFGGESVARELGFSTSIQSPLTYQIAGGVVGATGLGLILAGAIHAGRARDGHRELGIIELPELAAQPCRTPVRTGTPATLALSDGQKLRASVDSHSKLRFTLLDIASEALPSSSAPLLLRLHDKELAISLNHEQALLLRNGLLADERALARQELLQQQREHCSQAVDRAQGLGVPSTRAQVTPALTAWELAETACGSLFSPELRALRAQVQLVQEGFRHEDAFFASARPVSDEATVEDLTGAVVRIEKAISSADTEGVYIKFEREQTICMRSDL